MFYFKKSAPKVFTTKLHLCLERTIGRWRQQNMTFIAFVKMILLKFEVDGFSGLRRESDVRLGNYL